MKAQIRGPIVRADRDRSGDISANLFSLLSGFALPPLNDLIEIDYDLPR